MSDDKRPLVEKARDLIAAKLAQLDVPYAVIGGLALAQYGYRRFTEDVDLLIRKQDIKKIHAALEGLGYMRAFPGSKNLKDVENGVKVEFVLAGDYPGDGNVKPIAFPDPSVAQEEVGGVLVVSLKTLIELKLASGMTAPDRIKDLADVQELMRLKILPKAFAAQLHQYVQPKFVELWDATFGKPKKYVTLWRNKWLTANAKSIEEMAAKLEAAAGILRAMLADGIRLDPHGGTEDDYAYLFTSDPEIARKYDMHDESEFLGEEGETDNSPEGS